MTGDYESHVSRARRAARYRMLANEAESRAVKAPSQEIRIGFLTVANRWHKLADEVRSEAARYDPRA